QEPLATPPDGGSTSFQLSGPLFGEIDYFHPRAARRAALARPMASRKPSLSCGRWVRISIRGPSRRVRTTENWARSFKLDLPASLIVRVVGCFGRASPRKSPSSSFLLFAKP